MMEWAGLVLDALLILVVGIGIWQAMRLIAQLRDLRSGRVEMEKFVREFNTAVIRAEAGIKSLRAAARESGDDLEKLVEKAVMVRDELNFIVDSADNVAQRLTDKVSSVLKAEPVRDVRDTPPIAAKTVTATEAKKAETPKAEPVQQPSSKAEKELLQALQKLR